MTRQPGLRIYSTTDARIGFQEKEENGSILYREINFLSEAGSHICHKIPKHAYLTLSITLNVSRNYTITIFDTKALPNFAPTKPVKMFFLFFTPFFMPFSCSFASVKTVRGAELHSLLGFMSLSSFLGTI